MHIGILAGRFPHFCQDLGPFRVVSRGSTGEDQPAIVAFLDLSVGLNDADRILEAI